MTHPIPLKDDPAYGTAFFKLLIVRVYEAEEALILMNSHLWQAEEARARHQPAPQSDFNAWSRWRGAESRALNHEEIAACCERHAARLQADNSICQLEDR